MKLELTDDELNWLLATIRFYMRQMEDDKFPIEDCVRFLDKMWGQTKHPLADPKDRPFTTLIQHGKTITSVDHGRAHSGPMRRPMCLCGAEGLRDEKFDAYYCPNSRVWLEDKCNEPECENCVNRPEIHQ